MKIIEIIEPGFPEKNGGKYVESFDPEFMNGLGRVYSTDDIEKAKTFDDFGQAFEFWKTQSKTKPTRPDGKPNRPMTALTIEIKDK